MCPIRPARPTTLLLTLDAFNTIFYPRIPIAAQYTQTAQSLGFLSPNVSPDTVQAAFRVAFKQESARRPNYGRNTPGFGGPTEWWSNVIRSCFAGVAENTNRNGNRAMNAEDVPDFLVRRLLERFEGREAYELYGDVEEFFSRLRKWKMEERKIGGIDRIIIGIVSNSDDRISTILTSLGLQVGNAWADSGKPLPDQPHSLEDAKKDNRAAAAGKDIDFIVTSYEAGEEKPHKHIFDIAKARAREHLLGTGSSSEGNTNWKYVHVGDDYEQDYKGAVHAGWDSFLLPRDGFDYLPGTMNNHHSSRDQTKKLRTLSDIFPQLGLV